MKHTIEDVEITKGGYCHDCLTFYADGERIQVDGQFFVDKQGVLHHWHIFPDGKEQEVTVQYREP